VDPVYDGDPYSEEVRWNEWSMIIAPVFGYRLRKWGGFRPHLGMRPTLIFRWPRSSGSEIAGDLLFLAGGGWEL
jgi:hypothetical protein